MVQFRYSTPIGVPLTPDDAAGALRELQAAGRFASVTRDVLIDVVRVAVRDQALLVASGRWDPEHADPARFVPGDIAALRGMTTQPLLMPAIEFRIHDHGSKVTTVADVNRLLKDPPPISLLIDIYRATPHFIPLPATAALLATHPPDAQSVAAIRLPTAQTLVVFGADLPLDTSAYPWPAVAVDQLPRDAIPREMRTRGGAVTGVVLLADPDGKLRDECIWLLGANPDPELPFPDSLDHRRTALRGWRSAAQLRPLVETCAAAVAGAIWTPPPAGDGRPLPVNPLDARWATLRADDRFRRYERDGGAVRARTLDLAATSARAAALTGPVPPEAADGPAVRPGRFVSATDQPTPRPAAGVVWAPPSADPAMMRIARERLTLTALPVTPRGRARSHPQPPPVGDLDIDLQ